MSRQIAQELEEAASHFATDEVHFDECWRAHPSCAINRAIKAILFLEDHIDVMINGVVYDL